MTVPRCLASLPEHHQTPTQSNAVPALRKCMPRRSSLDLRFFRALPHTTTGSGAPPGSRNLSAETYPWCRVKFTKLRPHIENTQIASIRKSINAGHLSSPSASQTQPSRTELGNSPTRFDPDQSGPFCLRSSGVTVFWHHPASGRCLMG